MGSEASGPAGCRRAGPEVPDGTGQVGHHGAGESAAAAGIAGAQSVAGVHTLVQQLCGQAVRVAVGGDGSTHLGFGQGAEAVWVLHQFVMCGACRSAPVEQVALGVVADREAGGGSCFVQGRIATASTTGADRQSSKNTRCTELKGAQQHAPCLHIW